MKNIVFVTVLIALNGCNSGTNVKIDKSTSGNVMAITSQKNDVLHGPCAFFYEDGTLKSYGTFSFGRKRGIHLEFYNKPTGQVKTITNYLVVRGDEHVCSIQQFDTHGKLVTESSRLLIQSDTDFLQIEVLNPKFNNIQVVLNNYDEYFYVKKLPNERIYDNTGNRVLIPLRDFNDEIVRGYVNDWGIQPDSDTTGITVQETTYFEYPLKLGNR